MKNSFPAIQGFEIVKLIGRGGMGSVYLARQLSLNRPVAIKILPASMAANSSYVMRFQQEARAAAKVKHPSLVQIYDAGEEHELFYYVMEYINGETTAQRVVRKGRLDEKNALLIAESVAVALEHAWAEARLVHRDIKPDNILIDGDGTVKVADLGLAKMIDQSAMAITISRSIIGTPHYCAPEQVRGESRVDCRADIYALGATLYHYIVGHAPFADTSGVSAMVRSLTDYVPDPMDCHPDVSEYVAWLIEKMMAKDRNDRQRNWHEVLDDIDRCMEGRFPVSMPLPPRASTILRSEWRSRNARASFVPVPPLSSPVEAEETAEDRESVAASASRHFRIFLAIAAVFTVILYMIWFHMETKNRFHPVLNPAGNFLKNLFLPQNSGHGS